MPKNRIFKITEGTETKEVEALSYKKAVRSYQGSSKAKMITIEWMTKGGELFVKDQKLPLGRKKKIGHCLDLFGLGPFSDLEYSVFWHIN